MSRCIFEPNCIGRYKTLNLPHFKRPLGPYDFVTYPRGQVPRELVIGIQQIPSFENVRRLPVSLVCCVNVWDANKEVVFGIHMPVVLGKLLPCSHIP